MTALATPLPRSFSLIPEAWMDRISLAACLLLPWLLIFSRAGGDASSILIGVLFLLRSWQTNDWAWARSPVVRICLVAWAWMLLIVSPLAHSVSESFQTALPWIRWILLYAALTQWVLSTPGRLRLCGLNLAVMLFFVMVDTIWQYHFGISLTGHVPSDTYRLTGPMSNVKVGIFVAKLCFPAAAMLFYPAMLHHKRGKAAAACVFLAACITTVLLSGERTAFFTCLLAFGLGIAIIALNEPALRTKALLAAAAVIIISGGLLATQPVLQARVKWLHENLMNFSTSSYGTLDRIGIEMGADHWVHGAGFKGFRELCPSYLAPGELDQCNIHPHNPYVEWFAELGLPGLLLFIAFIAALSREGLRAVRANRGPGRVVAAMVLGVIAMHFFPLMATQSFFSNWPALLLWYSLAIAMSSLNMVKSPTEI